jgi:hypothetical protein
MVEVLVNPVIPILLAGLLAAFGAGADVRKPMSAHV